MALNHDPSVFTADCHLPPYRLVHSTALAIVPPEGAAWEPIQSAREDLRDGGLFRWPPHINVRYPFVEPIYFERFAETVAPVLAQTEPFRVRLDRFGAFGGQKRGVLWLEPRVVDTREPPAADPFAELHERLCAAVPGVERTGRPFVPHMTLTHTGSRKYAQGLADELQAQWTAEARAVEFDVRELLILCRSSATQPFRIAWRLPLGSGAAPPRADARVFESMPAAGSLRWRPRERRSLHSKVQSTYFQPPAQTPSE
jgi:2'-5' RNA ligase